MSKESLVCCTAISIACIFAILIVIMSNIEFVIDEKFIKFDCKIIKVEYPTELNFTDENLWVNCNCGKSCVSKSPCVKLYTDMTEDYIINKYPNDKYSKCTFRTRECNDAGNPLEIIKMLDHYINIAESYKNLTRICYKYIENEQIYLNIDNFLDNIIKYSTIFGIILIISCICSISLYREEYKVKNKKTKKNNKINSISDTDIEPINYIYKSQSNKN